MKIKLPLALLLILPAALASAADLQHDFASPPDSARPWVYWYFMDGNLSREGITADLESMKKVGIGGGIFLEVNIGIPRGSVEFMSKPWQALFKHAVAEADRLGLQIALGTGPGWCGTGGPWVKPEQSMQHLVASETTATGPSRFNALLPRPQPRTPYFGIKTLTPELKKQWQDYYRDVAVLAFPTPAGNARTSDIDEKALYHRDPYSSKPNVKPFLPAPADFPALPPDQCIDPTQILDLSSKLSPTGQLIWDVPPGNWTILRFGRTTTGQTTRPAPTPGLGFESDKFEKSSLDAHFNSFVETLIKQIGEPKNPTRGLTNLHFDSWEMSSQNWSAHFRDEFTRRRGYDPLRYLPAMLGRVVQSPEISERFLWDLRQTAQELVVENHALHLKELAHRHNLQFSVEPYDLNPAADLNLGATADVPMCEFWSKGFGYPTEYSCIEAASIAHTHGQTIVAAESFTGTDNWQQHPASMKAQGDWALATGINRIVFHRYQHQPWLDRFPGMTMGRYGVHWERTQTWWDMVPAYHLYLARCQQMLRQGISVADILYLTPEGAPHVFRPPASALTDGLPDRRGYNFDGIDPDTLITTASVKNGLITFPHGAAYRLLVLPRFNTMTPRLLSKIKSLVESGATVIGTPPKKSPSLVDYPACDAQLQKLASELWTSPTLGQGRLIPDTAPPSSDLYPDYAFTAQILAKMNLPPDFDSDTPLRYTHRRTDDADIYFIANREARSISATARFRVTARQPEWWNPLTAQIRDLPTFDQTPSLTSIPITLAPFESGFVIFRKPAAATPTRTPNFPPFTTIATLSAPWQVSFDPKWGGPDKITFNALDDWSQRPEPGIKYYSGKATYRTTFDAPPPHPNTRRYISLGTVKNLASVKLNGQDLGILWCDPWRAEIPPNLLQEKNNHLEITVANLWINRLIGDSALPESKRLTWTTRNPYKPTSPLQESGLRGPVTLDQSP